MMYYCLNNYKRRNTILKLMVKHGFILLKVNMTEAVITKLEIHFVATTTNNNTLAAYVDMVTAEVKEQNFDHYKPK